MSRKGNRIDNRIMEFFLGTLKNEMLYGREAESKTFEGLCKAIEQYIDCYSNERIKAKTKGEDNQWMQTPASCP